MAKTLKAVADLQIESVTSFLHYDAFGTFTHPKIRIKCGWRTYWIEYQRNNLKYSTRFTEALDDWERYRNVIDSEEVAGCITDVGGAPFGPAYAGHFERVDIGDVEKAAAITKLLTKYGNPNRRDQWLCHTLAFEAMGVPMGIIYTGREGEFDDLYAVPEQYRNHAMKFSRSAEASEIRAAHYAKEAKEKREAQERAATAQEGA